MIVSHACKFIYFGLPRTASTSMHQWLMEWGHRKGYQHDVNVPSGCEDYFKWTIVRNPYDRAVSLWYMAQSQVRHGFQQSAPFNTPTFYDFLLKVQDRGDRFYSTTQMDFLRKVKLDACLKFEDLPMCLWDLPFLDEHRIPPKLNSVNKKAWDKYYTPKEESLAWELYREDFDAYGYQRFNYPYL